ncbi:MAG TPA: hypothetical protein DCL21_06040 [Alphaproteobacteria bacterium]|nr:hypothetical protein [Alphaproteobacteria bacterium]
MSANNFSLKSSAKVVWLKRGSAIAVLAGFAWLVISAVSNNVDNETLEPMVVKAPEMVKQRPETPGGMKIDHQDKQLFDLLESETSSDAVNDAVIAKAKDLDAKNAELARQAIEKKALAEKVKVTKVAPKIVKVEPKAEVKKVEVAKPVVKTVKVEKPVQVAKKEAPKSVPVVKTSVANGWAVQLGSFRKNADAKRAVGVYNKKVGNILVGLKPYVKRVDLGEKGVVYRVYFTGLKDKEHAKQICSQLKVQKQACLRAKI